MPSKFMFIDQQSQNNDEHVDGEFHAVSFRYEFNQV